MYADPPAPAPTVTAEVAGNAVNRRGAIPVDSPDATVRQAIDAAGGLCGPPAALFLKADTRTRGPDGGPHPDRRRSRGRFPGAGSILTARTRMNSRPYRHNAESR